MDATLKFSTNPGFTIIEILIVVLILSIVAVAAMVNMGTTDQEKLEVTANEIANALRFAIREATSNGADSRFKVDRTNSKFEVYKAGATTDLVYNPIDKKTYVIQLGEDKHSQGISIQNPAFVFSYLGIGPQDDVYFDKYGFPIYISGGTRYQMTQGEITLSYNGQTKKVILTPQTGYVKVE